MKWVAGLAVLGLTLAALAEFPSTEPLAVGLVWTIAGAVTLAYGEDALSELSRVVREKV